MMTTLVLGASGATGMQVVEQLIHKGVHVKVLVRMPEKLPAAWKNLNDRLTIIKAGVSEITEEELATYVDGCEAIISCLGHNLTFRGIYGKPRLLVKNAVQLAYHAVKKLNPQSPVRFVLMNTAGILNQDIDESISLAQKILTALLRIFLPPYLDNEKAAAFLRNKKGDVSIEWVIVRPDTLINEDKVTNYQIYASPTRSAVFNPGQTSRINIAHFIASLITDQQTWHKWKKQMPVVYNETAVNE